MVWKTLTNSTGDYNLKQHAFVPKLINGWGNDRNISMCGHIRQINDEGKSELFNVVKNNGSENVNNKTVCKKCLKYSKL